MLEACGQLMSFLNQAGMVKSLKAFQDDMETYARNQKTIVSELPSSSRDESSQAQGGLNLMKTIKKVVVQKSRRDIDGKTLQTKNNNNWGAAQPQIAPKNTKLYSQEETEQIMEKLMNKLVASPNLLEDETLNSKIEKFFDNQTFQRMVEATDVMQDIPNLSVTNSFLQKDRQEAQSMIKTENTNSWEEDNKESQQNNPQGNIEKLQSQNQPQYQQEQDLKLLGQFNQSQQVSLPKNVTGNQQSSSSQQQQQQQQPNGLVTPTAGSNIPQNTEANSRIQDQLGNPSQVFDSNYQTPETLEDSTPLIDELTGDDDVGFDLYEVPEAGFPRISQQLAEQHDFPARAVSQVPKKEGYDAHKEYPSTVVAGVNLNSPDGGAPKPEEPQIPVIKQKSQIKKQTIFLPDYVKHPTSKDNFYPVQYDKIIYDVFNLKIIFDRERTGFEETKDFPIVINSIVAGRYQVMEYLGSAAFSKAIQCMDLVTNKIMCMKVIENNKDYFDQSIDEIKLLRYINCNGDPDQKNVLRYYDYFYHKEHLFIVTELLEDNLYEFYKFNRENEKEKYFTVGRLQKVAQQILVALDFIHSLRLIHCDLKPENILMKSKPNCEVKVIDFGSSCFIHDHLSSYVQSRSYRAPEVIIGCKYDYRIDIWSLGCILSELWTGNVLFQNENIQGLLSRVIAIVGPFPEWMMKEGRLVSNFFTREKLLYLEVVEEGDQSQPAENPDGQKNAVKTGKIQILVPKKSNLKARMKVNDNMFLDFVKQCLQIDYTRRPTAKEALNHPWITRCKYADGL